MTSKLMALAEIESSLIVLVLAAVLCGNMGFAFKLIIIIIDLMISIDLNNYIIYRISSKSRRMEKGRRIQSMDECAGARRVSGLVAALEEIRYIALLQSLNHTSSLNMFVFMLLPSAIC